MEITLTTENFESTVSAAELPVLVDFWATWCGPCRMLAPIVEKLAEEYEGKLIVGKINVDEEPALAMRFGVSSIPTLLLFRGGEAVGREVGYMPAENLKRGILAGI